MAYTQAQIVADACDETISCLVEGDYKITELFELVHKKEPLATQRGVACYCSKDDAWKVIKLTNNTLVYRKLR